MYTSYIISQQMSSLIIIELGGQPYGVWEDDIIRTAAVRSIHSLPMTPPQFAGVSDIEGRRIGSVSLITAEGSGSCAAGRVGAADATPEFVAGYCGNGCDDSDAGREHVAGRAGRSGEGSGSLRPDSEHLQ